MPGVECEPIKNQNWNAIGPYLFCPSVRKRWAQLTDNLNLPEGKDRRLPSPSTSVRHPISLEKTAYPKFCLTTTHIGPTEAVSTSTIIRDHQKPTSHLIREHHEVLTEENRRRCDPVKLEYHINTAHHQKGIRAP